jgi:hypothetical protein
MEFVMFTKELDYFIAHQDELVKKYRDKFLVIIGEKVIGVYDNISEAYWETQKNHELGTFMIQPCKPGKDAYTVTLSTPYLTQAA